MSYQFFFICNAVHLDLHSFPTRRSSDLVMKKLKRSEEYISCSRLWSALPRLPICSESGGGPIDPLQIGNLGRDRKSTRLNSSHVEISYAVFCLKKKKLKYTYIYNNLYLH